MIPAGTVTPRLIRARGKEALFALYLPGIPVFGLIGIVRLIWRLANRQKLPLFS